MTAHSAESQQAIVDAELARVLCSSAFAKSRRQQRFLRYLVQRTLNGDHTSLKETVVAVEVFERSADRFDPRADSIVRVEARRLRQRLARYYGGEGANARLRIELPVGCYVPALRWIAPPSAPTATRSARDLVERGETFLRQGGEAEIRKALDRFESALREAPDYAAAHKGAGRARIALVTAWHEPTVPWIDEARASLQRALALDARDAETVMLIGGLCHRFDHDWAAAEPWLRRAVEMDPQRASVHCGLGFYLVLAGRFEQAEDELRLARQLDQHYLNARLFMAGVRVAQRRWDDADKELDGLLDIAPRHFSAGLTRADVRRYRGQWDEAVALYRGVQRAFPEHAAGWLGEAQVFALRGECGDCERAMQAAAQRMGGRIPRYSLAKVLACAGRNDEALALLEDSAATRDPAFIFAGIEPAFDPLRGHPRFIELFRRACAAVTPASPLRQSADSAPLKGAAEGGRGWFIPAPK